jgi:DnaJ-class molecular chaperone with C-terminal Zn finger domain
MFSCRGTGQVQQIKKTFMGSFTKYVICPECAGEGYRPEKPCNVCKGEGRVKNDDTVKTAIPSGVDNNQVIKIEQKGEAGRRGGKPGDLYVRIFLKAHPVFDRKGDDLYVAKRDHNGASRPGKRDRNTNHRRQKAYCSKCLPGTESGKVFRVSGKGITRFSGYGRGNMYAPTNVEIPKKLSKRQKELLEQLRREGL